MGNPSSRSFVYNDYARNCIHVKAKKLVRRPEWRGEDLEEIEQQLAHHLISRAHRYDPQRSSLNTYIDRVTEYAVKLLLRAKRTAKRAAERDERSLDSLAPGGAAAFVEDATDASVIDRMASSEHCERIRNAVDELPERLRRVWERLLVGTEASAARDLKLSRRQIRNLREEIRRHFEQRGLGDL